jgi:hypothetical protein|nr:MAG TPA: hypothetical protein [Bacteriophage sp.]
MSGGSWNYLFCKDIDELMNGSSTELLQDMVDRLNSAGFKDAAKDTQRLVEYIKSASIRIETLFETLSPVFKAVEWFDSGDWGEETLNNEILKYRNARLDSYNKAVDDFVKVVKKHNWNIRNRNENEFIYGAIDRLAEQLKEGKVNENYNKEES